MQAAVARAALGFEKSAHASVDVFSRSLEQKSAETRKKAATRGRAEGLWRAKASVELQATEAALALAYGKRGDASELLPKP